MWDVPESDLLKRKAMEWKEIIKKHLIVEDEKENEGDDVEKGNKNVEAEEDNVIEAAEPNLQKGSVSLVGDNTPANVQNNDGITQYSSPFSPMTSSFVVEVDRAVEEVRSEKTLETRLNVSGIEAVNLSTRLADVVTDEECNEVTQPDQRGKTPRLKRTIILPDALRSPYVERAVSLRNGRDKSEDTLARCKFCDVGNKWYESELDLYLFYV
ncbi:hypothetical protein HanPI659440_Chr03g0118201 [Helianthus annuus]|nr:hypothetical protein HanPI659440_Chr03g0118201 [Helianthus annuus]